MDRLIETYFPKIVLWLGYIFIGAAILLSLYMVVMSYVFIFSHGVADFWGFVYTLMDASDIMLIEYWLEYLICIGCYTIGRGLIIASDKINTRY